MFNNWLTKFLKIKALALESSVSQLQHTAGDSILFLGKKILFIQQSLHRYLLGVYYVPGTDAGDISEKVA